MSEHPLVIGIAGPSCSGKTLLANALAEALGPDNTARLPLDSYYRDLSQLAIEELQQWNFDSPDALEHELYIHDLAALVNGETIQRPTYDFTTHTRRAEWQRIEPRPYIVTEGLFVLYWEASRALINAKIFITAESDVCLARRTGRDQRERGRTPQSITDQFNWTVLPMYEQYCAPTMPFADLVLDGHKPIGPNAEDVLRSIRDVHGRTC